MSRATTLPPSWAALAAALGGVSALADACGVDRVTIQRWGRGVRPSELVCKAVDAMARRRGLEPVFGSKGEP